MVLGCLQWLPPGLSDRPRPTTLIVANRNFLSRLEKYPLFEYSQSIGLYLANMMDLFYLFSTSTDLRSKETVKIVINTILFIIHIIEKPHLFDKILDKIRHNVCTEWKTNSNKKAINKLKNNGSEEVSYNYL
jgi:hypothetical protein